MNSKPVIADKLPDKFTLRLDLSKAVTPRLIPMHPVHRWFRFPHSYSPELVETILDTWQLEPGQRILDPFVGAGTTIRCALEKGIPAWGTDLSPLSVLVSTVKVTDYDPGKLRVVLGELKQGLEGADRGLRSNPSAAPSHDTSWVASERMKKAFSEPELNVLCTLRTEISRLDDAISGFFWVALLSILPEFSRAVADGGWFRWIERSDQAAIIVSRLWERVEEMVDDLEAISTHNGNADSELRKWGAQLLDARHLDQLGSKTFDGLITSPPYPNRHDYSRVFQLELLTMGQSEDDIFALRHDSLRSHVEAKLPSAVRSADKNGYRPPVLLSEKLNALPVDADRRIRPMLEGYFEDMYLVLKAAHEIMTEGARLALVVGNVRHAGVLFPVDEILAQTGEEAGYEHTGSWIVRLRGNSAQQMKTYGRLASRETVVFLRKRTTNSCA